MVLKFDYLVVGSGIAGLSFALKAAEAGTVAVVCKAGAEMSNTALAQGGLAAVTAPDDAFFFHQEDTLLAGSEHNLREAVSVVIKEAPACIEDLLRLGVPFDTDAGGKPLLGLEGGHSHHRIVHAKDKTGFHIQQQLVKAARQHQNIQIFEHHFSLDLLLAEDKEGNSYCAGAEVLDIAKAEKVTFLSKATVLATGGAGQVYQHTTNPAIATGDGLAMASRAGVKLADMEFVQFHPTALYAPGQVVFLISEAVRGFGGELVLPNGEAFMGRYHHLGSLAPRDVVAFAMQQEMQRLGSPCLYLDLRSLPQRSLAQKFPTIYAKLVEQGLDPAQELVPVVPAAHYFCGGIETNTWGQSSLSGLYACGECACTGLHGANRLASNSLPEGWIMGKRAATYAKQHVHREVNNPIFNRNALNLAPTAVTSDIESWKHELQNCMWENVGLVRCREGLEKAEGKIAELQERLAAGSFTLDVSGKELLNMLSVASQVVQSALQRKDSLGCHRCAADAPASSVGKAAFVEGINF